VAEKPLPSKPIWVTGREKQRKEEERGRERWRRGREVGGGRTRPSGAVGKS